MKYTYKNYQAQLGITGDGRKTCIVPEEVADDQKSFDGKTFPAIFRGEKIRVKLIGDDYGLHTSGTGDMIVRRA
jgi:hypothetical protein